MKLATLLIWLNAFLSAKYTVKMHHTIIIKAEVNVQEILQRKKYCFCPFFSAISGRHFLLDISILKGTQP